MRKIRIGNDFRIVWALERLGAPEDLTNATGAELRIKSVNVDQAIAYEQVAADKIRIALTSDVIIHTGIYRLIFTYLLPDGRQTVDIAAFNIVSNTENADHVDEFAVTSDMAIGFKGDSAYEVWLQEDDNAGKTKQQYFDWLQEPATGAAGLANSAAQAANNAAILANEKAEYANAQGDYAKGIGEGVAGNETIRIGAENIRLQKEADRTNAEGLRDSSETSRLNAEGLRDSAESSRRSAEVLREQAKADTIEATENANTATGLAIAAKDDYYNVVRPQIISQGEYATAQGDYAKQQGEAVDGRVTALEDKVDKNIGWYGIEFDETIANSSCKRIGSMDLHRQLPIQDRMKRCLLLDNGTVNYYLHDNDSTKKSDGSDAILDGSDGQVMVEIPEHWRKFEKDGTKWRVKISDYNVSGFHFVPKAYRSAYEATVERSTNKLSSVMNMNADYRGGNNNAGWDGTYRDLLGRPASSISGSNFAAYARNRGTRWCMDVYHIKKTMDWLYYIEFANFNSQLPFNPTLTAEGFKQGGLSGGVTDLNSTKWSAFNGYYPFIPMGYTNSLGNKTGVKPFDMPVEYDENIFTTNVPSYRGVENPFGHVWKWTDGIKINIQADSDGGKSQLYVCEDPLLFQHSNYVGYDLRGLLPRANGYVSKMIMGEFGEVMPSEANGGSTTYFADYFYTSLPSSGESQRGVLFGGYSAYGATAGLAHALTHYAFATANTHFGSRLCFIPE